MEQVKEEIPFNYFLLMFWQELNKRITRLVLDDSDDVLSYDEQLKVFNDSFYEILIRYLVLTNNKEFTN